MKKTLVEVPGVGDSTPYAYAQCATAGDFVFVAGQCGIDESYRPISSEFGDQTRQAFENVRLALVAAGSDFEDIVTMTVFLTDMRNSDEFLTIRREVLGETLSPSAMIGISALAHPSLLVEIQATAVKSSE